MKAVKNYITEALIQAGWNEKNIFQFEQLQKSKLLENIDSAEFFGGRGSINKKKTGYGSGLNEAGDSIVSQTRIAEKTFTQSLRLIMKMESLEERLDNLFSAITQDNSPGRLARVEKALENGAIKLYDILKIDESHGKELQLGKVEITLTFQIKTGIHKRTETPAINDLPMDGVIVEN